MKNSNFRQLLTNFGTIFSILGFFATIYVGFWYVPDWLKESRNERIRSAESELFQSVKELIYNDSVFSIQTLKSLIRAKEISLKDSLPLSIIDILTKTEESFMEDRFLPLNKRDLLINKIELIKSELSGKPEKTAKQLTGKSKSSFYTPLVSLIGALITLLIGFIGVYFKTKIDKEKEIEMSKIIEENKKINDELKYFRMNSDDERKKVINEIQSLLPKEVFAPQAEKQWIYDDTCIVHDYIINNQFRISVDTYRYLSNWEIQLFSRNQESLIYLFETMVKDASFLSKPIEEYEIKHNRIIYNRFTWDVEISIVVMALRDLLSRIESYKKKIEK